MITFGESRTIRAWRETARTEGFRAGQIAALEKVVRVLQPQPGGDWTLPADWLSEEMAYLRATLEDAGGREAKCPRCGEPESGLFSGSSCDACGWKNWNPEEDDA